MISPTTPPAADISAEISAGSPAHDSRLIQPSSDLNFSANDVPACRKSPPDLSIPTPTPRPIDAVAGARNHIVASSPSLSPPSSPSDSADRVSYDDNNDDDDDDHHHGGDDSANGDDGDNCQNDTNSVTRPSLYRHGPVPRRAPFEQYYGDVPRPVPILDELKSNHLEGVYNLSFLLLAFALAYLFAKSIVESGFNAGPSAICFTILFRDLRVMLPLVLPLPLFFLPAYVLVSAHARRRLSTRTVYVAHTITLLVLFGSVTSTLFIVQLNPLFGVAVGLILIIVALKVHSYVATNLLLAEETQQRRELSRETRGRSRERSSSSRVTDSAPSPPQSSPTRLAKRSTTRKADARRRAISSATKAATPPKTSDRAQSEPRELRRRSHTASLPASGAPRDSAPAAAADVVVVRAGEVSASSVDGHGGNGRVPRTDNEERLDNGRCSQHRQRTKSPVVVPSATGVVYPRNVTMGNLAYFMVAPTLVYETGYPRSGRFRVEYVAWYMFQAFICLLVEYVLLMQFCVPAWKAATTTDRLWWFSIKLALPCFIMWLLMFWGFFHCALNVVAEMTRFADRQFYREWWNATDLSEFWRSWNIPVHEWCVRHLYVETVRRRQMNAKAAVLGTFVLSAILHEYVCLVGFRLLRPYMFGGMMLQVPLVKYSTRWAGTRTGNYLMWVMFLGQSWVSLLYCRDYLLANGRLMCGG